MQGVLILIFSDMQLQNMKYKKIIIAMEEFRAEPQHIKEWTVVIVPREISLEFPSRSMNMAEVSFDGQSFITPLEPDGRGSHWFRLDDKINNSHYDRTGKPLNFQLKILNKWSDPDIPGDIKSTIENNQQAKNTWNKITPKAKWDWVRWIRATNNPETREKRIKVASSKLSTGDRRPCCFNSALCTEPYVSKSWQLNIE